VSQELCGGTHVSETGEIGQFRILSEGSVGAGLRRIEAVTGHAAEAFVSERLDVLEHAAEILECSPEELEQKVVGLLEELRATRKENDRLRHVLARQDFENLLSEVQTLDTGGNVALLSAQVETNQVETLREMTDWFRDRYPSSIAVLGGVIDGRPHLVVAVTQDLVKRGLHAGELVKHTARMIGGGGGGRPTLAEAGGRDASLLGEALSNVRKLVEGMLT
jgi:alanyl-tRNA synthetase